MKFVKKKTKVYTAPGLDLHDNFVNLNADYDVRTFNRVKKEAEFISKKLGTNLINKYKIIHRIVTISTSSLVLVDD